MSALPSSTCTQRAEQTNAARRLGRAGFRDHARPVFSLDTAGDLQRLGQSEQRFAPAWEHEAIQAARRTNIIAGRWQLAIAATGALWVLWPALATILAGGTPA